MRVGSKRHSRALWRKEASGPGPGGREGASALPQLRLSLWVGVRLVLRLGQGPRNAAGPPRPHTTRGAQRATQSLGLGLEGWAWRGWGR